MFGTVDAVYVNAALVGYQSISLRGSASEITTAVGTLSWLPPDVNDNCTLAATLSKAMSDGIYSVGINITAAVRSPPRLTLQLAQSVVIAEGANLPLAKVLSQLADSLNLRSTIYVLEVAVSFASPQVGPFTIDSMNFSNGGLIVSRTEGGLKGNIFKQFVIVRNLLYSHRQHRFGRRSSAQQHRFSSG